MPVCANNVDRAVAGCFPNNTCGRGYACQLPARICCPAGTTSGIPMCPSGVQASALCVNNACGLGMACTRVGSQSVCCMGNDYFIIIVDVLVIHSL